MPLRSDLLETIPGENPAGANLRYDRVYDQIKEARTEDDESLPAGEWQRAVKKADFALVAKLAGAALATRSKDLQLLAWLTEAQLKREGMAALAACLQTFQAMQERFWETLYPEIDLETGQGRIYSFDVAGGKYEEQRFYSIGSGSVFARGSLKKLYRDGMSAEDVALVLMHALYDAADDDSATGGPDVSRRIYPIIATVTADGFDRLSDEQAGRYAEAVVAERMQDPDGPPAPLRSTAAS